MNPLNNRNKEQIEISLEPSLNIISILKFSILKVACFTHMYESPYLYFFLVNEIIKDLGDFVHLLSQFISRPQYIIVPNIKRNYLLNIKYSIHLVGLINRLSFGNQRSLN